jgi:hypothetical protein
MTKVTCQAREDKIQTGDLAEDPALSTAQEKAKRIPTAIVSTTKSAPR